MGREYRDYDGDAGRGDGLPWAVRRPRRFLSPPVHEQPRHRRQELHLRPEFGGNLSRSNDEPSRRGDLQQVTNDWEITTAGSLGSTTWSVSANASITGDPDIAWAGKQTFNIPFFPHRDIELFGSLITAAGPPPDVISLVSGQATVDGNPVGKPFGVTDTVKGIGFFGWTTGLVRLKGLDDNGGGHDFSVATTGQVTPVTGGLGSFTAVVQSVPEPSTAALFTVGVMVMMGVIGQRSVHSSSLAW
jgi:hypothetical protein